MWMAPCSAPIFGQPSWPSSPHPGGGPGRPGQQTRAGGAAEPPPGHALLQDLTQNGYGHFADTALKERRLLGAAAVQPSGAVSGRGQWPGRGAAVPRSPRRYPAQRPLSPGTGAGAHQQLHGRKAGEVSHAVAGAGTEPCTAGPAAGLGGEGAGDLARDQEGALEPGYRPTELVEVAALVPITLR